MQSSFRCSGEILESPWVMSLMGLVLRRVDRLSGTAGDYGAVRTPCVAGGGVDKHGVLRLHFVIGFAK